MINPFKIGMRVIALDDNHETLEFGDGEVIEIDGDNVLVTFGTEDDGTEIDYWFDGHELGIVTHVDGKPV